MEKINNINKINIIEHSITIFNTKLIEELIKTLKNNKLPKPLAIFQETKNSTQIILKNKEDKLLYSKEFTTIPWNSINKFEYIVSTSKFTTNGDFIIKLKRKQY